mgnify:CR=1 FL=1
MTQGNDLEAQRLEETLNSQIGQFNEQLEYNRNQFNVFPQDFSIKIKDGKTRINVRDTYDIANSQVITQVSENESYSVVEIALVNSNLLTIKNDFITKPIAVNGSLTNNSSNFTFSKGLKLYNIYQS